MVAELIVIPVIATPDMTGAGGAVVKVKFAEVDDWLAEFAETTSKLYVTPCDSPVSVTEWFVVRVVFGAEDKP
jgi:hypothetical protein